MADNLKRKNEENKDCGDNNDEWIGPMPSEAIQTKKPKS